MSERVRYERDGDVGSITLSAPPLNLFDRELTVDLVSAVEAAERDGPRALVVRAEGEVFTGGVDVNIFDGLSGEDARRFATELAALAQRVEDSRFPPWPSSVACA